MRIVYFSTPPFADCDFPLVREFQRMGLEVFYFIDLPCYSLRSTLIDIKKQIPENGIFKASRYKEFAAYKSYMDLNNVYVINRLNQSVLNFKNITLYKELVGKIQKIKPDAINIVGHIDVLASMLLVFRKKIVLTVHDPFLHSGEQSFRRSFFRKLAMKGIPKFVLLNNKQKEAFMTAFKLQPNQVCITRLGVYDCISNFISENSPDESFSKNILFFGRISPYKGVEYLLEAMKMVHKEVPDAKLTIAGGGKMYFDISPFENLTYINIRNRYIGMEELAGLISKAQIVVCPYTDATQSGVVMTSFSLGIPVVATNVGGMAETMKDGKYGLIVPPRNAQEIAKALIRLLLSESEVEKMREHIKKDFFNEHDWKAIAETYIKFYQK